MLVKLSISLLCSVALLGGCGSMPVEKKSTETVTPTPAAAAVNPGPDACALIEKSEIAAVQGAQVGSVVPSSRISGALATAQCYYAVASADGTKNLSVHLEVTQRDPKSPTQNAVADYWKNTFEIVKERKRKKKVENKPLAVPGIGDAAFWMGNMKAGALYTLNKDKVVRVSVGGPDDLQAKIAKSKTLTEKALKRL